MRICILGGGFGGLYTALQLQDYPWPEAPEITLVERNPQFLFSPLLYELVSGEMQAWEIAPSYAELLVDTHVQHVQAQAQAVDVASRTITLDSGALLAYDYLVVALGGETPMQAVPGVADFAIPFRTLADAQRLKAQIPLWQQQSQPTIAIGGAGASGVELACKLADCLPQARIILIDRGDRVLRRMAEGSRAVAEKALHERGVKLYLNTDILSVSPEHVVIQSQGAEPELMPIAGILWTGGTVVAPLVTELALPHTPEGRLEVGSTLQVREHPEIFALGDAAQGDPLVPATAQAALQQAGYCAWNIWALSQNRPVLAFRYEALGEMLSLGTDAASLTSLGLTLNGRLAYWARRAVYLLRLPTFDHQVRVARSWLQQEWQKLVP